MDKNTKQVLVFSIALALAIPGLYFATKYAHQKAGSDAHNFIHRINEMRTTTEVDVEGRWETISGPYDHEHEEHKSPYQWLAFYEDQVRVHFKNQDEQVYDYQLSHEFLTWRRDGKIVADFMIVFPDGNIRLSPLGPDQTIDGKRASKLYDFKKVN